MTRKLRFEIKSKDVAGRIGKVEINGKTIETPAIMPVYNPNSPVIPIDELQRVFGAPALMTNAYMALKNEELKKEYIEKGIHKALGFDGIIATDSGSYQLMVYGGVTTTNKSIIEFQENIGSDIGSFLDIPTLPDAYKPRAEEQLDITLKRAKDALDAKFLVNAGVQGGKYLDLRKKAAGEIGANFELVAVGGIVRLMEDYRFSELADVIAAVKSTIPTNRLVHAFGLGHPMVFGLAAALGCDLFDSAAYALYAKEGRYLTRDGTKRISELEYLPCSCPVCSSHTAMDMQEKDLAMHNLYVTFEEIRRVKQAIKDGSLWELVQIRARSHPRLLAALERMVEYPYLAELDPITKGSAFFWGGGESAKRSEIVNAKRRLLNVESDNLVHIAPYGDIPAELSDIYPFNSTMMPEENEIFGTARDIEKIKKIMDYQFGKGAGDLVPGNVKIVRSKKTRRIRRIYYKNELIASIRASDHMILPKKLLLDKLHKKFEKPRLRVVIDDEAVPFVAEGKSVFSKFVTGVDTDLRCGDFALIVDSNDKLVACGSLVLSPKEMLDFDRGPAVNVR